MNNRRLLDRMVTPGWMNTALRIARMGKPWAESRQLLEVALRDEIESPTGRKKTATILAGSWLKPAPEAESVVAWAREMAGGDLRIWHLGVLLANYSFVDDVCREVGRTTALGEDIHTGAVRSAMKAQWGDRDVVNVATRSAIRTLRSFGWLKGKEGESVSERGNCLSPDHTTTPWLLHALMVARGVQEIDLRDALTSPEFFMLQMPTHLGNGYPHLERFTEGSGRVVVGIVKKPGSSIPPTKQMSLGIDVPGQLELESD